MKRILAIRLYNYDKSNEISQQDNWNANARLWIQKDGSVFKRYVYKDDITRKNIHNLKKIVQNDRMYEIPEIAMPIDLYGRWNQIYGYTMPYCSGIPIEDFLLSDKVDVKLQQLSLINLANVINKLPHGIYIGDLHGKNVLVEATGEIHLIDIDGFSTKDCGITCPLSYREEVIGVKYLKKYHHRDGQFKISRESDIFCFYMLVLSWLLKVNAFELEKSIIFLYLEYLCDLKFPANIIKSIYNLYKEYDNSIEIVHLQEIDIDRIVDFCYFSFKRKNLREEQREDIQMALIDRVQQLDKNETYEQRAEKLAERECRWAVMRIEEKIKRREYEIVNGKKHISGGTSLIFYSVGDNRCFNDSPYYIGGSCEQYHVNNEYEAQYFSNAIMKRLRKEGCTCELKVDSKTRANGYGFFDALLKGHTTTYIYRISYIFEWKI